MPKDTSVNEHPLATHPDLTQAKIMISGCETQGMSRMSFPISPGSDGEMACSAFAVCLPKAANSTRPAKMVSASSMAPAYRA